MRRILLPYLAVLGLLACACSDGDTPRALVATPDTAAAACAPASDTAPCAGSSLAAVEPAAAWPRDAAARALLEAVLSEPSLPGATGFEARRAAIVGRAKGEPVWFVRTPRHTEPQRADAVRELAAFQASRRHYEAVQGILRRHRHQPERVRELVLREGYLYSEDPDRSFALGSLVSPQDLFDEDALWIHRGEQLIRARRQGNSYIYATGPEAGQRARLMHLDRIGTGEVPEPLHRDLRSLRYRLAFDRARVVHATATHLVAELRYGTHWVTSVLSSSSAHLELEAELVPETSREVIATAKRLSERRARVRQSLRETVARQVGERLPFDEPKTEVGQEDGILRNLWRFAYLEGRTEYEHNGDRYPVFTASGSPRVPQVCIDFVVDTLERATGTWYGTVVQERSRQRGKLDLRRWGRTALRRTDSFVDFAREHDAWFEVLEFGPDERTPMGDKPRFFSELEGRVEDFQPGDIILIRGFTPWDSERAHSHVFMIYETDPITGMPILVAGNAGPANLWSWETEARRTPARSLRYRIRPNLDWLADVVVAPSEPSNPAPLLVGSSRSS